MRDMTGRDSAHATESIVIKCSAVLEALRTGIMCCLLDEDLTFLWRDSSFFSSIGYTAERFGDLFSTLRQCYAAVPGMFSCIRQELTQAAESERQDIELTVRLSLRESGYSWKRLYGVVREDSLAGRKVLQVESMGVDALAAGKGELERLYWQKLQYFHFILDTYEGSAYINDMDTYELLYVSQHSREVLGVPAVKATGHKYYGVVQGRTSPCPFCANSKITENESYKWEFQNPVLERTFRIRSRIIDWKGYRAWLELSHDMYSMEYKLAKKDRERDALVRSVPGGLARVDGRSIRTILWYNGSFLNLVGYTKGEFEQEMHSQCSYVHPDDKERVTAVMLQSRGTGRPTMVENHIFTQNGKVRILLMACNCVSGEKDQDGIPSHYTVGIDVTAERTEQARQRQALEDICQAAQIINDAKTDFLPSMSHGIRTPMNAIIGMAAIAQANLQSPERIQDCLNKINVSSRHLLSLINEVLDMSRIESGKIDLISENVPLPELIEDITDIFRFLAAERHLELQINADHMRHEKVIADRNRLQQVLVDLLSNAIKYTPEGGSMGLRVREIPAFAKDKGQYEFIVADNGIGMSGDFIPHILKPFSRTREPKTNQMQGTGLGMAITQNIISMMNDTIEVKNVLGEGSQPIVAVSFKLHEKAEDNNAELSGLPVLVVNDDQVICESAAEILGDLGIRSSWVLSGKEAIHRVVEAREAEDGFFSLILDWKMPGMDGLETLKVI